MLEVDRGTEPYTSPAARKSVKSSIDQYARVIEGNMHRQHYGLKANLLVLWVFTSKARQRKFIDSMETGYSSCREISLFLQATQFKFSRIEKKVQSYLSERFQ